jgi:hypothetical protein
MNHSRTCDARVLTLGVALGLALAVPLAGANPAPRDAWLDTAIAQALSGRLTDAESVLVGLLSEAPNDATILNALGNVRTLEGKPADAFYREAIKARPESAGIRLNLAGALLDLGREAEAESVAAGAIADAGNLENARRLVGLPGTAADDSTARAANVPVSHRDIARLLARAARRLPIAPAPGRPAPASTNSPVISRFGGTRASGPAEERPALYWGP